MPLAKVMLAYDLEADCQKFFDQQFLPALRTLARAYVARLPARNS
jgi:hypothetical protein